MSTARGERRLSLAASREALKQLPLYELFELPGRPHVVYMLRSYADTADPRQAAEQARSDLPFLFKAFETGQIGPKRMAKMHGGKPRISTIHEYLDWTVTAQAAQEDDELDFGGFRVLILLPRYVSYWPYPDCPGNVEGKTPAYGLGAPKPPMPMLQSHGRALSAATIRSGPGYLEIPFVATSEAKRGRGYCRCLLEAIEHIARSLHLPKLLLCSTNDPIVKSTWHHLGFEFTTEEQMEHWDTPHSDLVYLQNTTQMHKDVPAPGVYKAVRIKQGLFSQRMYARLDVQPKRPKIHLPPPKKAPPKKTLPGMSQQPSLSYTSRALSNTPSMMLGCQSEAHSALMGQLALPQGNTPLLMLGDAMHTPQHQHYQSVLARGNGGYSNLGPGDFGKGHRPLGSVQGTGPILELGPPDSHVPVQASGIAAASSQAPVAAAPAPAPVPALTPEQVQQQYLKQMQAQQKQHMLMLKQKQEQQKLQEQQQLQAAAGLPSSWPKDRPSLNLANIRPSPTSATGATAGGLAHANSLVAQVPLPGLGLTGFDHQPAVQGRNSSMLHDGGHVLDDGAGYGSLPSAINGYEPGIIPPFNTQVPGHLTPGGYGSQTSMVGQSMPGMQAPASGLVPISGGLHPQGHW